MDGIPGRRPGYATTQMVGTMLADSLSLMGRVSWKLSAGENLDFSWLQTRPPSWFCLGQTHDLCDEAWNEGNGGKFIANWWKFPSDRQKTNWEVESSFPSAERWNGNYFGDPEAWRGVASLKQKVESQPQSLAAPETPWAIISWLQQILVMVGFISFEGNYIFWQILNQKRGLRPITFSVSQQFLTLGSR